MNNNYKICVIGLGYVGLPLLIEFSKKFKCIGFDLNSNRVNELNDFVDSTMEVSSDSLEKAVKKGLLITNDDADIRDYNIYIITVPTPVDSFKKPDFNPLISASKTVSKFLKKNDVVIYESTVYPGATEEICVKTLQKYSKLKYNIDFFVGYSPERINPGDKIYTLTNIVKVTSGSDEKTSKLVDYLYSTIIKAGTFRASSIKVAEASKVIENSQRDINIAFVNELSKIFSLVGIDTLDVLEAASTKWNFLPFKPGLVGGHCIGVDPYYLAQKATELGYHPEIILSGRKLNDNMGKFIVSEFIKLMIKKSVKIVDSNVLILGFTFKENCPDFRNTKVIDIINEFKEYNVNLTVYDPYVDKSAVYDEYNLDVKNRISNKSKFDGVILAVAHNEFKNFQLGKFLKPNNVVYDVKGFLNKEIIDKRL